MATQDEIIVKQANKISALKGHINDLRKVSETKQKQISDLLKELESAHEYHGKVNGHEEYTRGMRDGFQKSAKANRDRIKDLEKKNRELRSRVIFLENELYPIPRDEDDEDESLEDGYWSKDWVPKPDGSLNHPKSLKEMLAERGTGHGGYPGGTE